MYKIILFLGGGALFAGLCAFGIYYFIGGTASPKDESPSVVRIVYTHSGKTAIFLRAYLKGALGNDGGGVELNARMYQDGSFANVPSDLDKDSPTRINFEPVSGLEALHEVNIGNFDGAVVDADSFVYAVSRGMPLVAVAELGHDRKDRPAHAFVFRRAVIKEVPEDVQGKRVGVNNEDYPFNRIITEEFLESAGVPISEISIHERASVEELIEDLSNGEVDLAYLSVRSIQQLEKIDKAIDFKYQKLDWVEPEISHALLVFSKDFVEQNPQDVESILRGYKTQIDFEKKLSPEERLQVPPKSTRNIFQLDVDFMGMSLPQSDDEPLVSIALLARIQDLLHKHRFINLKTNLEAFVDNSFIERVLDEGKI